MAISIYVVEMSEDAGSLPSKDSHVTTWFDEHFSLTDGAFRKAPAYTTTAPPGAWRGEHARQMRTL